jgi:sugar lactone lactonase YvrE
MGTPKLRGPSVALVSAICTALLATAFVAVASAGESMTFSGMVGNPRHDAPESVAVDSSGNVYVAELATLNTVTIDQVTKYDADGNFMDVIAAPGTGLGQVSDPSSVAVAPNDDLYVVDKGNDRVTRFDALGNYLGQWGASGPGNGQFNNAEGIAVDSLGNVYVADSVNKRIQKFTSSGGWLNAWPVVPAANVSPLEIAVDSADVLYVVGGSMVRRFDTDGVLLSEWASTGATGVAIDPSDHAWVTSSSSVIHRYDATGTLLGDVSASGPLDGQLMSPQGIASAPSGQMYVADTGNGRIQRFSNAGVFETSWGMYPGPGVMDNPTGLAVDVDGNVYVTNQTEDLIQKFAPDGTFLTAWGGTGSLNGKLNDPAAIAVSTDGFVYVADTKNQRIQKFDTSGNYVSQWGSFGTADGQMSSPQGIAVDGAGRVFVADTTNNRIQRFSSTGVFQASWGALGTGDGQFKAPHGIAIDADGDAWVADTTNNRLQEFTANGVFKSKVAGTSASALDGRFSGPTDLEFDALGTMYVTDKTNARVQRLSATGVYISKFGSLGLDIGQFTSLAGIAIDATGRVLVADSGNQRVETFIDANGPDTTILSGPPGVSSSTSASFTFQTTEPGSTFECKLDGGVYVACSSGQSYPGLAAGPHTFSVRAADNLANVGDPASYPWAIDVTPPDVNIDSTPLLLTSSPNASFSFSSSEPGSTFRCSVDTGAATTCLSPFATTVTAGDHTFSVYAIDLAGNTGQPASYTWTMDNTPPSVNITSAPPVLTTANSASFSFNSGDPSASFDCHIDSLPYAPCTSPSSYSGLTGGQHTFYVRASDPLGNMSAPATKLWTVDAESHRPDAQISTATTYVGDGIYNSTGTSQTQTLKAAVGKTVSFKIRIENDGSDTDQYTLLGIGSGNGYTVTYFLGSTDITADVVAGTYTTGIASTASKVYTLKVKVGKSAGTSRAITVRATSGHAATELDVVKAVARRV